MRIKGLSLKDLAIAVCDHLAKNGIEVVLTGGACVSIYTRNRYMSYDLDFVVISEERRSKINKLLSELGFYEQGMFFKHKDTDYFLHFVAPPLSIGQEPVQKVGELKKGKRTLRLLSPTDCVKDRLAAYFHWGDRPSLDQAVWVARDRRINTSEIRRWSVREGKLEGFRTFLGRVRTAT